MSPELAALSALALVHFATIFVAQRFLTRDIGRDGNAGTRENLDDRLSPVSLRLRRATANFTENVGPFIIAVLVVVLAGKTSTLTAVLAWAYVAARVLYVPAYALAWVPWRSVIWFAGFVATLALLVLGLI
ncbi:MAPEG family protein [Pararhodobacter aggregans]|uniref:MAPEG family protein n=1 Tax=Pararhodobacter aggregans TaxID=404875 RepID=A0A2T7UWG1_9RHOB|nr:MAPEG family protein [Pararhodobacter aggregans]PTX04632.1 putative MAPEG superfamily protein [Pararhodobacter aggregans]PVE48974.1 MAPEG family protein [Pararhodobacter aggregans]